VILPGGPHPCGADRRRPWPASRRSRRGSRPVPTCGADRRRPFPASPWTGLLLALCLLSLLVPLSGLVCLSPAPARAAPSPSPNSALLPDALALTAVRTTEAGLELDIRVTNTGSQPLYTAEVMLWRNTSVATDRDSFDRLIAGVSASTGARLGYPFETAYRVLSTDKTTFPAGASVSLTLTAKWEELGLTQQGVYLAGAQLHATTSAGAAGVVCAFAPTLIVRPGTVEARRVNVVALTSAPSLLGGNQFSDDHLADELALPTGSARGGRLAQLASTAAQTGGDWLIDPALYQAVTIMAGGYQVLNDAGSSPGQGQAAAAHWLALLDSLPRQQGGRILWGDPDVALAGQLGDPAVLQRADAALAAALDAAAGSPPSTGLTAVARLPLVVHPAGGVLDGAAWDLLRSLAPARGLALADASLVGAGAPLVPVLAVAFPDGPTIDGVTDGTSAATVVQRAQRALAEDYLAAAEGRPSVRLLTTSDDLAVASRPTPAWVGAETLASVAPESVEAPAAPQPRLGPANRDAAGQIAGDLAILGQLTGSTSPDPWASSATAAVSQSWPDAASALAYADLAHRLISQRLGRVQVSFFQNIVLTARDTSFPVTVINGLSSPIRVRLALESSSPIRLTVEYAGIIQVAAGAHVTVALSPTIRANGTVTVTARLTTESGQPFGQPVATPITVNESGRLAWIIVAVSGAIVAGGTMWRVTTGQRSRRDGAPGATVAAATEVADTVPAAPAPPRAGGDHA